MVSTGRRNVMLSHAGTFAAKLAVPLATMAAILVVVAADPSSIFHPARARGETSRRGVGQSGAITLSSCEERPWLCTDPEPPYEGHYVGHDEPSILFYSATAGSGNSATYKLTLPTEPPTPPVQNGSGGTYDFQLFPAFWFGMAMCDTQSFPEFTRTCVPNSDANIFDSPDPHAPDYIGHHPGTAFMELQFYPPGWVPQFVWTSCDATQWCAALTINSYSKDPNHGKLNNADCIKKYGIEYQNSAFVTPSGSSFDPFPLLMGQGDTLTVQMNDTPAGFQATIDDLTNGQSGSMTASIENGFRQVLFDPAGGKCQLLPYAFHPMYATSGPHTRVPWAAHSFNVAGAFELGHFEYCSSAPLGFGKCPKRGVNERRRDEDDTHCFKAKESLNIQIGGCTADDSDFDGPGYQSVWPGTNPAQDGRLHPSPVIFTSPVFQPQAAGASPQNYDQVGFESNLPREEFGFGLGCNILTGAGCSIPPAHSEFYPFFTLGTGSGGSCVWQFGGGNIPGTTDSMGGSAHAEFGVPIQLPYAGFSKGRPAAHRAFENFRQVLSNNPCPAPSP
jgi:hypothetical protein